eukprot:1767997-Pleurochrysis_carterae.AAC.1
MDLSAASEETSAGDGTMCIFSGLQQQMEPSIATTPAKSPEKKSSKYTFVSDGSSGVRVGCS